MISKTNPTHRSIRGFTVVEMMITAAVVGVVLLASAQWFRTGSFALTGSLSEHALQMEATTAADMMGRLLNGADPLSIQIVSSASGPWSDLSFAVGARRRRFYASGRKLLFTDGDASPKTLSGNLAGVTFALEQNQIPTLLHWSVRLAARRGSREVVISGIQYIRTPVE